MVLAITQPLPWMSLLCYVNNAGEHFQDHEEPSWKQLLLVGRPSRKREDQTYEQAFGKGALRVPETLLPHDSTCGDTKASSPARPELAWFSSAGRLGQLRQLGSAEPLPLFLKALRPRGRARQVRSQGRGFQASMCTGQTQTWPHSKQPGV